MKKCVATSGNGNRFLKCNLIFQVKELCIYINILVSFHKYFGFDGTLTPTAIEMNHTIEVITKLIR